MRLADISWPSGRERAAECIPGPTERTFVYRRAGATAPAFVYPRPDRVSESRSKGLLSEKDGKGARMKRKFLWIGLLLTLFLSACTPQNRVIGDCLKEAVAFDFQPEDPVIPPCMKERFSQKKMVLFGEIHHVKEHGDFMAALLTELHDAGFRWYLQEVGVAEGAVIDAYLQGEPVAVPLGQYAYDEAVIAQIATLNRELRNSGREDEQIRYIGFDIHHMDTYKPSLHALAELYSGQKLDKNDEPEAWLAQIDDGLNEEQKKTLARLTEAEAATKAIKESWSHTKREIFMEEQLRHVVERSAPEEKILVNTGIFHAQLVSEWTLDQDHNFEWLALRMKHALSEDTVYTVGVNVVEGELLRSWHRTETYAYRAETEAGRTDLIARLARDYPGRHVFVDFEKIGAPIEDVPVQNPMRDTDIPLRAQFDAMLVYPTATPVSNPMLP